MYCFDPEVSSNDLTVDGASRDLLGLEGRGLGAGDVPDLQAAGLVGQEDDARLRQRPRGARELRVLHVVQHHRGALKDSPDVPT